MIENGQLVMLICPKGKRYFRIYNPEEVLNTHEGTLTFSEFPDLDFGHQITTHLGRVFRVVKPTLYDCVKHIKRSTQILYPKDIGYILVKLGIGPGVRVVEAGCGSGSLTMSLAWAVGDEGHVFTYERRKEFADLCLDNLRKVKLDHRVTITDRDIAEGFDQTDGDALFLDVRTPWEYLDQACKALKPGSPVGFLLPTTNQVSDLLKGLEERMYEDIEVLEIFIRQYKPVTDRLRPDDRMVAHTGFLIFARTAPDLSC